MKRKIIVFLMIFFVLSLVGCSKKEPTLTTEVSTEEVLLDYKDFTNKEEMKEQTSEVSDKNFKISYINETKDGLTEGDFKGIDSPEVIISTLKEKEGLSNTLKLNAFKITDTYMDTKIVLDFNENPVNNKDYEELIIASIVNSFINTYGVSQVEILVNTVHIRGYEGTLGIFYQELEEYPIVENPEVYEELSPEEIYIPEEVTETETESVTETETEEVATENSTESIEEGTEEEIENSTTDIED